jgi:S1-C subfamily serine protease
VLGGIGVVVTVALVSVGGAAVIRSAVSESGGASVCPGADGRTAELRRCLQPLLAFVEVPDGTGSGVLLDDGYVVTNAHVVDPWERATVTVGGETYDEVEVVGVDAFADVALLGPIEGTDGGIALTETTIASDDEPDVFLVGYPGGIEGDDPAIAISDGVVSRLREDRNTGLTYVQTDAAIAGGQSGGALVDGNGAVLGISGLGFAEEFALALGTGDVLAAIERIRTSGGDERSTVPSTGAGLTTEGELQLAPDRPSGAVVMPPGAERTVELRVAAGAPVSVDVSAGFEVIGANDAFVDGMVEDGMIDEAQAEEEPRLDEPEPGTYRFDVPADEAVYVWIAMVDEAVEVAVSADSPFVVHPGTVDGVPLQVGSTERAILDFFATEAIHELEVSEPGDLAVEVSAGASDAYVVVLPPGEEYDYLETEISADDEGGGLYGLDARHEFTVGDDEVGTWRVVVGTWDGLITGYTVRVAAD